MSSGMRDFILAIFATFAVVISANEDLLEAIAERDIQKVEILLQTPDVEVNFTVRVRSNQYLDNYIKIVNPLLRALEFDPFDGIAEAMTMVIIRAGADPNVAYIDGCTALHMACVHGCIKVVDELLKRNADIEAIHPHYGRPLNIAIIKDHTELALFLIKDRKPNLEAKMRYIHRTPLQQACFYERLTVVEALLDAGGNLEAVDKNGNTAMHLAAKHGNVEIMTILKERGAKVNFENGITPPLHGAVSGNYLEAVKFMIESLGARVDATDDSGNTAMHIAASLGHMEMMTILKERGAKVNFENGITSPLHQAVRGNYLEAATFLIESLGARIDATNEYGNSVLNFAIITKRDGEIVRMLVEHGAVQDLKNA